MTEQKRSKTDPKGRNSSALDPKKFGDNNSSAQKEENYDWENALVASDSASVADSTHNIRSPRKKSSNISVIATFASVIEEEHASPSSVAGEIGGEDLRSHITTDSDKSKTIPEQLLRIAEESDEEQVVFESYHSPRSRHSSIFNNMLGAISPRSKKTNSPSMRTSRFPFCDDASSILDGVSRISHHTNCTSDDQKTEIAGNTNSHVAERKKRAFFSDDEDAYDATEPANPKPQDGNVDPLADKKRQPSQVTPLTSNKHQPDQTTTLVIDKGHSAKSKKGEAGQVGNSKRRSGRTNPTTSDRNQVVPKQITTPVYKKKGQADQATPLAKNKRQDGRVTPNSYNENINVENAHSNDTMETAKSKDLTLAIGSDDSTAKASSYAHISKKWDILPHWVVVSFFLCAALAFISAIVYVVLALPDVWQALGWSKSDEPNAERVQAMREIATSVSGVISLDDENSSQFKAFDWLATKDTVSLETTRGVLMERYIVSLLYFATEGEGWKSQSNFLSEDNVCGWNKATADKDVLLGIVCDDQLNVKQINLSENGLGGTIPREVALLKSLQMLDLSFNYVGGEIPVEIQNLGNLEVLSLLSNQVKGSIPSVIGNMSTLISLDLSSNLLTGTMPTELGNLFRLERLRLSNNGLEGALPPSIKKLKKLVELNIFRNHFSGRIPKGISELPNLTDLNIASNNFIGDLDENFCARDRDYVSFWSDCRGENPVVQCSCCTTCCVQKKDGSLQC